MALSKYFPFNFRFDELAVIVFVEVVVPDMSGQCSVFFFSFFFEGLVM